MFCEHAGNLVLAVYYALAIKNLYVKDENIPSNSKRRHLGKFGDYHDSLHGFIIPAPLIAQIGKNDVYSELRLITGKDILEFALQDIAAMQSSFSGKMVFLECDDNPKLISFYEANGFVRSDSGTIQNPDELVQMVRYL